MRTLFYILLIIPFLSCKAQVLSGPNTNHNLPFVGTWEYQNGNDIFRVTIWEDGEYLKGDYWFIEVTNGVETVICESNYQFTNTDFYYGDVIFGGSNDGVLMYAQIDDNTINCADESLPRKRIYGNASLAIQSSCFGCPITALWEVKMLRGFKLASQPTEFSVPNNVVMTKVE